MKTFKKVLALLLVAALAAGLAIVGTVAYLTHEDEEVNVFTVGNVEVELIEQQRNDQKNPTALVDFEQNKGMMPVVGSISQKDGKYNIPNPSNYVDKIVYARNAGASAAYMRIRVAVPTYENTTDTPTDSSTNNLHWNYVGDATRTKIQTAIGATKFDDAAVSAPVKTGPIVIDGQEYNVYTFTYSEPIAPKMNTGIIMCGLYLDERVDYNPVTGMYEDVEGNEFYIRNGIVNVPVIVEAIQADGFASATDAFTAANFPENPWDQSEKVTVNNADEFKAALDALTGAEGDTTIDAKDTEVNMYYGLNAKKVPAGTTVTIKNAKVTGKNYGNGVDGTVIFENCTFTNTGAYSIHFDAGSGNVIFKNCELVGWCSFGTAIKSVEMYDCAISGNGTYAMNRFYQDTVMINCTIDCSNANGEDVYPDGISAVGGATVTLSGCTITDADFEVAENATIACNGKVYHETVKNDER